jgi:hypothetical protein
MQQLPVTFHPSKLKQTALLIISILFVISGIFLIEKGNLLIGISNTLFFGICSIVFMITLIPNSSYLQVTEKGIEMKSLFRSTHIPWEVIDGFTPKRVLLNKMIMINFNEYYLKSAKLNSKKGVFPDTYGMSAEKLTALLTEYKAQVSQSHFM